MVFFFAAFFGDLQMGIQVVSNGDLKMGIVHF